jgi:hypothetical protein
MEGDDDVLQMPTILKKTFAETEKLRYILSNEESSFLSLN